MPVAGDDVVLGFSTGGPNSSNANLGVQLSSVTVQTGGGNLFVSGAISLQSGGSIVVEEKHGASSCDAP